MTITLAISEFEQLWAQTESLNLHRRGYANDRGESGIETLFTTPPSLGAGCHWEIQLDAEFSLAIWDIQGRDNVQVQIESNEPPIEFGVLLSGRISTN